MIRIILILLVMASAVNADTNLLEIVDQTPPAPVELIRLSESGVLTIDTANAGCDDECVKQLIDISTDGTSATESGILTIDTNPSDIIYTYCYNGTMPDSSRLYFSEECTRQLEEMPAYPNDKDPINCVPQQEIIEALKSLLRKAEPDTSGVTTLECGCSCAQSVAEAYECLAGQARAEAKYFEEKHKLIERIEQNGICK